MSVPNTGPHIKIVQVHTITCQKCSHNWQPDKGIEIGIMPVRCPKCKSKNYDKPKSRLGRPAKLHRKDTLTINVGEEQPINE